MEVSCSHKTRFRGKHPKSDVGTHAAQVAQARYVADGLRYLSGELHRLLEVVVLTAQGIMPGTLRQGELETALILLDELSQQGQRFNSTSPDGMSPGCVRLAEF